MGMPDNEAISVIEAAPNKPITVIGSPKIKAGFDQTCIKQAIQSRLAPGVSELILNPDAHAGYGAPIGCVMVSPSHIYPGPVGVDIKCSMSLLQLDLPGIEIRRAPIRRALIEAICKRIPTGPGKGSRHAEKGREISSDFGMRAVVEGASPEICAQLGIPPHWTLACEDGVHTGESGDAQELRERLATMIRSGALTRAEEKVSQLGSYGGGNHFGECNTVSLVNGQIDRSMAEGFGLIDGAVSFLSHCGSRGFGFQLANNQFRLLGEKFIREGIPFPGGDKELVFAELGTPEATDYLADMALAANFATINHLLINTLVLEAFQELFPGVRGELVYFISHNIARSEERNGQRVWVHRKGATRAFPAGHKDLQASRYSSTGHPILLPGNPRSGSVVMVAEPGAAVSCYSVNHGAGRAMGRRAAFRSLDQGKVNADLDRCDILTNCRNYPLDEAPEVYKDFEEVLKSVQMAGLARPIARLAASFVIKDGDSSNGGAA